MIRVAICDDEQNIRSYLATLIHRQETVCEIREYASADAYLSAGVKHDLLFLDIELSPESTACAIPDKTTASGSICSAGSARSAAPMDGIALARRLRCMDLDKQPLIVFVTGHDSYVYEAFNVEAFQYLLKPIDEKRFAEIFQRAVEKITSQSEQQRKSLIFQQAGIRKVVPLDSIYYVESQGHKILLHLKESMLEYYGKISNLEQALSGQFCRIHKGYLINLSYVEEYTHRAVKLANGTSLIISKYKYDDFVKAHLRFLQ